MTSTIEMRDRIFENSVTAVITDIIWERLIVHFDMTLQISDRIDLSTPLDFYLVNGKGEAEAKLLVDDTGGTKYRASVNVTNPGYCRCLYTGIYRLRICQGLDVLCAPKPSLKLVEKLRNKSTLFMHGDRNLGYSVEFYMSDDDISFEIMMQIQDMSRKSIDSWRDKYGTKTPRTVKIIWKIKNTIGRNKRKTIKSYYKYCLKKHLSVSHKKKIMFMTEQGNEISRNLKCVRDRMIERGLDSNFDILESARSIVEKEGNKYSDWLKVIDKVAQADILFIDDHVPFMDWMMIDDKTTVIQLWHAGAGYKSVGYSRWGREGSPRAFSCHRQYNYGITPSRNIAFFFSEQFGINEEQIIPTGIPRMDAYLDEKHITDTRKKLYSDMPQLEGKKVILFAPTYRGKNRKNATYPYEKIDFEALYEFCRKDYIVLFKMHPWVSEAVPIKEEYKDRFIDMNSYTNINDLFYITDILITDYSSSVFEFSLMRKPMLFYAFDEHQYAYSRGFHREYRPACPGRICNTFDELIRALNEKDYEDFKLDDYIKYHFDNIDTCATDRVIDWFILDKMPASFKKAIEEKEIDNNRMKDLHFDIHTDRINEIKRQL